MKRTHHASPSNYISAPLAPHPELSDEEELLQHDVHPSRSSARMCPMIDNIPLAGQQAEQYGAGAEQSSSHNSFKEFSLRSSRRRVDHSDRNTDSINVLPQAQLINSAISTQSAGDINNVEKLQAGKNDVSSIAGGRPEWSASARCYGCSFCGREFRSAQALGGHMNIHRRDRARLRGTASFDVVLPRPPNCSSAADMLQSPVAHSYDMQAQASSLTPLPRPCEVVTANYRDQEVIYFHEARLAEFSKMKMRCTSRPVSHNLMSQQLINSAPQKSPWQPPSAAIISNSACRGGSDQLMNFPHDPRPINVSGCVLNLSPQPSHDAQQVYPGQHANVSNGAVIMSTAPTESRKNPISANYKQLPADFDTNKAASSQSGFTVPVVSNKRPFSQWLMDGCSLSANSCLIRVEQQGGAEAFVIRPSPCMAFGAQPSSAAAGGCTELVPSLDLELRLGRH